MLLALTGFLKKSYDMSMLEYQKQNCVLTMQQGLGCYYASFPESKERLKDSPESGYLFATMIVLM